MKYTKRLSVSLPDDLERQIAELRKTERFCRSSYAEIIRTVILIGIKEIKDGKDPRIA